MEAPRIEEAFYDLSLLIYKKQTLLTLSFFCGQSSYISHVGDLTNANNVKADTNTKGTIVSIIDKQQ